MPATVMILGASGMLGSMLVDYLATYSNFQLIATIRNSDLRPLLQARFPAIEWRVFDAASATPLDVSGCDAIINAIGIIKPFIHDDQPDEVERAIQINATLPYRLAHWAQGCRVIQIATDCVYSGRQGMYDENAAFDPLDVYGKTKSLGEARYPHVHHLRCSIIGPEAKAPASLLEWFLGQPPGGRVNGFTNHRWNGVTTLHFARLCHAIIRDQIPLPLIQHVVAAEPISKHDMLVNFARAYQRHDITIHPTEAATAIDRTLSTQDAATHRALWEAAGYPVVPSVPQMIAELAAYPYQMKGLL